MSRMAALGPSNSSSQRLLRKWINFVQGFQPLRPANFTKMRPMYLLSQHVRAARSATEAHMTNAPKGKIAIVTGARDGIGLGIAG